MSKSKLFKLKEWLTLEDAARHLTIVLGEVITKSDVLHFALDGHLKLSVNFPNTAHARPGFIGYKDEHSENEFENIDYLEGNNNHNNNNKLYFVYSDKESIRINGIWNLPMIGGEKLDVEQAYQTLTGGPEVKHGIMDNCFIEDLQGNMYLIQMFGNDKYYLDIFPLLTTPTYYPANKLPPDCVFVVRTAALRDFELKLNETQKSDTEKPLATTERNTLLTMIGIMAKDGYGDDLSKPYPLAKDIQEAADLLGIKISEDTIANKLKDAKKILDEKSE